MPQADLHLAQIGQIALTVTDLDRAVAFYRDKLGIPFLFRAPSLAFFDCAGVRLMLGPPEGSGERHSTVVYFRVDNVERVHETLSSRSVVFEGKPHLIAKMQDHDLWMAFFRDPDGNLLALMSEVPHHQRNQRQRAERAVYLLPEWSAMPIACSGLRPCESGFQASARCG